MPVRSHLQTAVVTLVNTAATVLHYQCVQLSSSQCCYQLLAKSRCTVSCCWCWLQGPRDRIYFFQSTQPAFPAVHPRHQQGKRFCCLMWESTSAYHSCDCMNMFYCTQWQLFQNDDVASNKVAELQWCMGRLCSLRMTSILRPVSHMETLKLSSPEKMPCPMQSYECCPLSESQRELQLLRWLPNYVYQTDLLSTHTLVALWHYLQSHVWIEVLCSQYCWSACLEFVMSSLELCAWNSCCLQNLRSRQSLYFDAGISQTLCMTSATKLLSTESNSNTTFSETVKDTTDFAYLQSCVTSQPLWWPHASCGTSVRRHQLSLPQHHAQFAKWASSSRNCVFISMHAAVCLAWCYIA